MDIFLDAKFHLVTVIIKRFESVRVHQYGSDYYDDTALTPLK